jgi:hypothetical protein
MSIELPETPQIDLHVLQFPPTAIYDITNGNGTLVFRILSLGSGPLVSTPARTWLPWKEHWFSTKGVDVAALLAVGPIKLTLVHRSTGGVIDQTIQTIANQLAVTTSFKFQIYSNGLLSQADWISGVPSSVSSPNYYFVEQNAPIANRAARPLFQIDAADSKLLKSMTWFTLDKTVAGYLVGAPDGTFITLGTATSGSWPTNGWYYAAP